MRKLAYRSLSITLVLALAACGSDSNNPPNNPDSGGGGTPDSGGGGTPDSGGGGGTPDSGGGTPDSGSANIPDGGFIGMYDFSCSGAPDPTTAPDPLTVSGTLTDFQSSAAIADVLVSGRLRATDMEIASTTTASDGSFTLTAASGGAPVDAYVFFDDQDTMYPDTYLYPPDPMAENVTDLGAGTISESTLSLVYGVFVTGGHVAGTGTTIVLVVDCAGTPIEGATVSFSPAPGQLSYFDGTTPQSGPATYDNGVAFGFNAPVPDPTAPDTEVSATFMGVDLESHTFGVFAESITATIIHP
jgi:hypothetical protein